MKRAIRRYHQNRMKVKAARLWVRWFTRRRDILPDKSTLGRMASQHCTYIHSSYKYERKLGILIKDARANLYVKDLELENGQQVEEEYLGMLSSMSEECDEMAFAFGHDMHRGMLMTEYEQNLVKCNQLQ